MKNMSITKQEILCFIGIMLLLCCTEGVIDMVQGVA
jgi:hypothetical protein